MGPSTEAEASHGGLLGARVPPPLRRCARVCAGHPNYRPWEPSKTAPIFDVIRIRGRICGFLSKSDERVPFFPRDLSNVLSGSTIHYG